MKLTLVVNDDLTLPQRLAKARSISGLTLKELAAGIGRSYVTVSKYESGEIKEPAFAVVARWAEVTGAPIEWFVDAIVAKPENDDDPTDSDGDDGAKVYAPWDLNPEPAD